jgi:hypothetical protein
LFQPGDDWSCFLLMIGVLDYQWLLFTDDWIYCNEIFFPSSQRVLLMKIGTIVNWENYVGGL